MSGILDKKWRSFSEQAIPVHTHGDNRMELRKVFYAGAHAMFNQIMEGTRSAENEAEAMKKMNALYDELMQFSKSQIAARKETTDG